MNTGQREMAYCSIDLEMLPIDDFKVLGCGHCFCKACLLEWSDQRLLNCPKCRVEEHRKVDELNSMHSHSGPLFVDEPPADEVNKLEVNFLVHKQLVRRTKTIRILKAAVKEMCTIEQAGAGVKIGGAVGGLVGTGMVIGGSIAALTGIGAPVGIPIALAGAAIGGIGGVTVGGGVAVEAIMKNKHLKDANDHLNADYFGAIQLRIILGRAAKNPKFANQIDFPTQDAASLIGILGRIAKFGTASVAFGRAIAAGLARGVTSAGLHIAGIVISAALIPVDVYQLITSSIKIHKKEKSEVAANVERLASDLEVELFKLLKDRDYSLVELNRFDDNQNQHTLLLANQQDENENEVNNNSYEDIMKNHVVLLDLVGDEDDSYLECLEKWDKMGALTDISDVDEESYVMVNPV